MMNTGHDLLLLAAGFVLTTVLGGTLGYVFQRLTWNHQHDVQRLDQDREQASKAFEEISRLLDRRLHRMRLVYAAIGDAARVARSGNEHNEPSQTEPRHHSIKWDAHLEHREVNRAVFEPAAVHDPFA